MFKCTYAKYTNFGLQKFRLDFDGLRTLRMNEDSVFQFQVKRYAELVMDTYLVMTLPTIWSPILPPQNCDDHWRPYDFKWIDNLGTQLIKQVTFTAGGQIIQQFSGQYLYNLVERDFPQAKKLLYYNMTGNVPELNDPANAFGRTHQYPSAYYTQDQLGAEPSIRARKIYVPLNIWFSLAAKMAFPLVSMQYNELYINVELRPINELFVVRDVTSPDPVPNYIQSNQNDLLFQFNRFLQPPPNIALDYSQADQRTNWNADVHLISTYGFLSDEETQMFAQDQQQYLVKEVYTYNYPNVTGSKRVQLDSLSMVANWMWYFQRSDADLRNEWSNYSNWPYTNVLPSNVIDPVGPDIPDLYLDPCSSEFGYYTPFANPPLQEPTGYVITGVFSPANQKTIMQYWALLLDGKYRENQLDAGVFSYVEKYARSLGNAPEGLYCYNFGLNTSPFDFQPSGAINLSKFKTIEFEFSTYQPPLDPSAQVYVICNPDNGNVIGVNKPSWRIYDYNYDLTVMEERYNVLTFTSGIAALQYAR
jgi:hypothetical protein